MCLLALDGALAFSAFKSFDIIWWVVLDCAVCACLKLKLKNINIRIQSLTLQLPPENDFLVESAQWIVLTFLELRSLELLVWRKWLSGIVFFVFGALQLRPTVHTTPKVTVFTEIHLFKHVGVWIFLLIVLSSKCRYRWRASKYAPRVAMEGQLWALGYTQRRSADGAGECVRTRQSRLLQCENQGKNVRFPRVPIMSNE